MYLNILKKKKPYKIHFKPKAEIKIQININRNVIKLINPALLDLDESNQNKIKIRILEIDTIIAQSII